MLKRASAVSQRILSLLDDGEWHSQSAIAIEAGSIVPPGEALRAAEKSRTENLKMKGSKPKARKVPRSTSFLIASGQRSKAVESIHSLTATGRIERRLHEGEKQIRLLRKVERLLVLVTEDEVIANHNGENMIQTVIDYRTLNRSSLEELRRMETELEAFHHRFPGIVQARAMVSQARAMKEFTDA